jgi:hypothetical protein
MSDIFLSYSSNERSTAEKVERVLSKSWSVWWDPKIPPGRRYDDVIREALAEARCVVVLWSKAAVKSDHVCDEADLARTQGKLIPVKIEETELPVGFGRIETANLIGWQGDEQHAEFQNLLGELRRRLSPSPVPAAPNPFEWLDGLLPPLKPRPTEKADRLEGLLGARAKPLLESALPDFLVAQEPGSPRSLGMPKRSLADIFSAPQAAQPRSGVVFEDDFSDNRNRWAERRDHGKIVMRIRDGKYEIDHKVERSSWFTWNGVAMDPARDFEIEATVTPFGFDHFESTPEPEQPGFGLLFGGEDGENFHIVRLRADGRMAVETHAAGRSSEVIPWSLCLPIYLAREKHDVPTIKLAARRKGRVVEFRVNGEWIEDAEFPSLSGKNVGFSVHNRISLWVKHLKVTQT